MVLDLNYMLAVKGLQEEDPDFKLITKALKAMNVLLARQETLPAVAVCIGMFEHLYADTRHYEHRHEEHSLHPLAAVVTLLKVNEFNPSEGRIRAHRQVLVMLQVLVEHSYIFAVLPDDSCYSSREHREDYLHRCGSLLHRYENTGKKDLEQLQQYRKRMIFPCTNFVESIASVLTVRQLAANPPFWKAVKTMLERAAVSALWKVRGG